MNIRIKFITFMLVIFVLNGCVLVDGGSLKSELELNYNTMFGTDFDYLGRVEVIEVSNDHIVVQMSAEEFHSRYLQNSKPVEQTLNLNNEYSIRVTAIDDPMYRKGQKEALLTYDIESKVICSKKKCVEISQDIEGW
ncbi:hypothetical protein DS745_03870 [Anaerobacillus alkaliphilus]|uniref:Uncharacterized protein n=1 Tax=Anaerobacillus alkaliphilus TaxID=1548597 RepID=A0A4Q0VYJ1_9BACI|nr:hypothetical protein [Anaerobacillus alkaliphilus]RXJ04530.1 hypothetical protein DS745_03870 [Anaerobacillus alkaliphilus]